MDRPVWGNWLSDYTTYLFLKYVKIALRLDPDVAQLYWGYWENITTLSAPSLVNKKIKRVQTKQVEREFSNSNMEDYLKYKLLFLPGNPSIRNFIKSKLVFGSLKKQ